MTTVWLPQKRHRVVATKVAEGHVRLELHDHRTLQAALRAQVVVGGGVVAVETTDDALYDAAVQLAMARLDAAIKSLIGQGRLLTFEEDEVVSLIDETGCIELLEYEAPPPPPVQRSSRKRRPEQAAATCSISGKRGCASGRFFQLRGPRVRAHSVEADHLGITF